MKNSLLLIIALIFINHKVCQSQSDSRTCIKNLVQWKELGPFSMPNSGISSIGSGNGRLGIGIINNIAISKINPNQLLANSLCGGLFFSGNKGQTWRNAGSDFWYRSGCGFAAFDPIEESTWYATSTMGGEYRMRKDIQNPIGSLGGVYRTFDAGKSWEVIGDFSSFAEGESTVISKIVIDPNHNNIAYIATFSGLYKSRNINSKNSQVSWEKILDGYIEDIELIASYTSELIVSYELNGVWNIAKSNKKGQNWKSLPIPQSFYSETNKIVLEVTEADPNKIFVLNQKNKTELWMYHLKTKNWTAKASGITNHCCRAHAFCVSNFDTKDVYLGYPSSSGKSLFFAKSDDEGVTFKTVKTSLYHNDVEEIVTPFSNCKECSTEVYVGTHGGVSYSPDKNKINENLEDRNYGLGIAKSQGGSSATNTNPERIAMGIDHDGTVISSGTYSDSWIPTWTTVSGGDGGQAVIDYSDANNVWTTINDMSHRLSQTGGAKDYKSTSFKSVGKNVYNSLVQNKVLPEVVYSRSKTNKEIGDFEDIFRSNTRGIGNVEQISDFYKYNHLPSEYYCFGKILSSASDKNYLYVVLTTPKNWNAKLFRNTSVMDSANLVMKSWQELPLPQEGCYNVVVDLFNPNILYFNYNGGTGNEAKFYIADYSKPNPEFINIAGEYSKGGLPNTRVFNIIQDRNDSTGIYTGTDFGVFYIDKKKISFTNENEPHPYKWKLVGTMLPHLPIDGMDINYQAKKIRVFTQGRGVWEHDLFCQ